MENTRLIKRRIKTAKNIAQITKAMEMVAASKMRRAQNQALASRPYALKLNQILANLVKLVDPGIHPLLLKSRKRHKAKIAILLISSDKGLCGSLNSNLFRFLFSWQPTTKEIYDEFVFLTVGKKAKEFVLRSQQNLLADFGSLGDWPEFERILPISKILLDGFQKGEFQKVIIVYNDFVSTLKQQPTARQLLPIAAEVFRGEEEKEEETKKFVAKEYIFEPDPKTILKWLLPYYFELQIYQCLLEGMASEQSARMVSMKNASDNAQDITTELTLNFNKARQQQITREINEVTVASLAIKH